jgi:hypothetical protein
MKADNVETAIPGRSKYSHQLKTGPPGFNEFNSRPDGELSGFYNGIRKPDDLSGF